MTKTTQTELRDAIDFMKADSGKGTKARKQEKFRSIYDALVGHIVTGERYDDAGVGPATARDAVEQVFGGVPEYSDTLSSTLSIPYTDGEQSLESLVDDLDEIAELSGDEQTEAVADALLKHAEPSLVTLALLDDENIGLGTSQMRDAFFDGTRDERKHREAFVEYTTDFIRLAQDDALPTRPIVGEPFSPMLAVSESRGEPDEPNVAQKKLDGYRVIIHIKQEEAGPKVYAFSRRLNDVTESLPELQDIDWPTSGSYILDGEVLSESGSYSETSERIGRKSENVGRDVEMNFHLFDCIRYDDEYIADSSFRDRHSLVEQFVRDINSEYLASVDLQHDIEEAKDNAVSNGDEGIIVKSLEAPYEFGKRSSYWQKQKLDEESIDVVISGFHEGDGESTGTLGAVEIESADGVSLGRSGSGFSDAQRETIWENKDEWMGRTIEIEARGIGSQGKLRMPIFIRDRSDDGEPDSWDRIQEVMKDV